MDLSREQQKLEWRELRTVILLIPCVLGTAMATGLISMLLSVVVNFLIGVWGVRVWRLLAYSGGMGLGNHFDWSRSDSHGSGR